MRVCAAYIGPMFWGVAGVWGRGGVAEGLGGIRGVNSLAVGLSENSLALGLRVKVEVEGEGGGLPLSVGEVEGFA